MMFASKTPRDLNHDPKPWLFISDQVFGELRCDHDKGYHDVSGTWWAFSPRPEFDHIQHNKPNPILVDFREYARNTGNSPRLAAHWTRSDEVWLDVTTALLGDAPMGTPEQEKHARHVLTRLARLAEVES